MGAAGDARRLVVAKEQKAAGLPASSDVTLTWPGVVTNEDTWADSGTGSTGEFAYTSGTGLHYVQLDLGAAYTVDQIKVWHYARDGRTYHNTKTQVSADGSTWVTVFDSAVSGEYAETAAGKTHTFSPRSVRYVRDWLNGSTSNSGNHWVEIEVWGTRTRVYAGQHYEKNINSGEVTKYYHFGGSRVAMRRGSVVQYLLADHLNSTALTLNSPGSKVAELRYRAFGETRYNGPPSGTPTDYRFTGQRQDGGLALYHMGARWYDPYLGRWLSPDSIVPDPANPQSLNRYSYTRNNPLKFRDPSGHMEIYGGSFAPYSDYWYTYVNPKAPGCQSDLEFIKQGASLAVDFTPVLGDAKGLAEVFTGKDLITGESLGAWRFLGLVGLSEVRHLRHADEAVSLIKSTSRIDPGWLSSWTKETEQMHWIPQQFHTQLKKLFPEISADALGFTEAIEKGFHKFVHGKGADGTRHLAYNGQVQQWLDLALQNGRVPTLEEFYQFIGELRDEYLKLYEDYLTQANEY